MQSLIPNIFLWLYLFLHLIVEIVVYQEIQHLTDYDIRTTKRVTKMVVSETFLSWYCLVLQLKCR